MIAAALSTTVEPGARPVEVLVVRLQEGTQHYSFGLLVSQVGALLRRQNVTLRPTEQPGPWRAVGEAQYEDRWLPIYDLAAALRLLAPWKMGLSTTLRPYLLVIQGSAGQQALLSADDVTEIGVCRLERIHPLPSWLRRQLHPALAWAGIRSADLTMVQSTADAEARPVDKDAGLLLLLDCAPLLSEAR
jgi:hypothetical protein